MGNFNFSNIFALAALAAVIILALGLMEVKDTTPSSKNIITVQGNGEASAIPDEASLSVRVQTESSSLSDAQEKNAEIVDRIKKALSGEITTQYFNAQPIYDYRASPPKIVSQRVTHTLKVVVDVEDAGKTSDDAIKAGATSIDSISFIFSENLEKEINDEALAQAMSSAKKKAGTLANLANANLGKVVNIIESSFSIPYPGPILALEARAESDFTPEERTATTSITVSYELR